MSNLTNVHPSYSARIDEWRQMRITYEGERAVKSEGVTFLPATQGMQADGLAVGQPGFHAYQSYKMRARYPGAVREAVHNFIGTMHEKAATIELPESMEYMRTRATRRGESLEALLRRINREQLITSRVGLLGDVIDEGPRSGEVYLSTYDGEVIKNWDEGQRDDPEIETLNLVVIDETSDELQPDWHWKRIEKYRVLMLGEPDQNEPAGTAIYQVAAVRERTQVAPSDFFVPLINGQPALEIQLTIINADDLDPEPMAPVLLDLSNLTLSTYRNSADYEHGLFMSSNDTLVTIGADEEDPSTPVRVGSDGRISLPTGGDAKYIGVSSTGLPEQRQAIENKNQRASEMTLSLGDNASRQRESGEALGIRRAARTVTLHDIARTGAAGAEAALKKLARWMGADDSQVMVAPYLDFAEAPITGRDVVDWMQAKRDGAPVSTRTIHQVLSERGVPVEPLEDELAQIATEQQAAAEAQQNGAVGDGAE